MYALGFKVMQGLNIHIFIWYGGFISGLTHIGLHYFVVVPYLRKKGEIKSFEEFVSWRIVPLFFRYQRIKKADCGASVGRDLMWIPLVMSFLCFIIFLVLGVLAV